MSTTTLGTTKIGEADVARWIGELSYPVYISHELVRLAMLKWMPGHSGVAVFVLMTILASILLMVCVEGPFERMRARFVERRNTLKTA